MVPLGPGYALPSFIRRVRSWGQPCYNLFFIQERTIAFTRH